MMNHRLAQSLFTSPITSSFTSALSIASMVVALAATASGGCAASDAVGPDATPIVESPAGHYDVRTSYVLAAPPPDAAAVLAELDAATDGADDPARYLVDKLVARLPEGDPQRIAVALSPYLAAYLQNRLSAIAPDLSPSIHALSEGLNRIARRVDTVEELSVSADGAARRSVNTLRFGAVAVDFTQIDPIDTTAVLSGDQLQIGSHAVRMPYGTMLRVGFDHAVLPDVVPGTFDLGVALGKLVDCDRLGVVVSNWMGIGSPDLYAHACTTAMTMIAADIYAKIDALDAQPFVIEVSGVARGEDLNGDGVMDRIVEGRWTGAFGTAIFEGTRR